MKKKYILRNNLSVFLLGMFLLAAMKEIRAQEAFQYGYPQSIQRSEGMKFAFAPNFTRKGNGNSSPSAGAVWSTFLTGQYSPELIQWQVDRYQKKQGRSHLSLANKGDSLAEARYRFLQQEIAMQEDILKRQRMEFQNLQRQIAALEYRVDQSEQATQTAIASLRPDQEGSRNHDQSGQQIHSPYVYDQNPQNDQQYHRNKLAENRSKIEKRNDYLQMLRRMEFSLARKEKGYSSQNQAVRQSNTSTFAQFLTGRKMMNPAENHYDPNAGAPMMAQTPVMNPQISEKSQEIRTRDQYMARSERNFRENRSGEPEQILYEESQDPMNERVLANDGFNELETSIGSSNPVRLVSGSIQKEDLPQKRQRSENENRRVFRPNGNFLP